MKNTMSNYPSEGVLHQTSEPLTNNSNLVTHKISLENFEKIRSMDMKDGFWEVYDEDGTLHLKGTYLNGERNGVFEEYYEDGTLKHKRTYNNGLEEGVWESYHENGNLWVKESYLNGRMEGEWNLYFPDGTLFMKGIYNNGRMEGEWVVYDNGEISRKIFYVDDNISKETIYYRW